MKISTFLTALALGLFVSGAAFALDSATPDKPDADAKAAREARSIECTREANAAGLHHKERWRVREKCLKGK